MVIQPKYPIYIPSKGRFDVCSTAQFLTKDGVPFHLVVEEPEAEKYYAHFQQASILVLPFCDQGSVVPARNWIKAHAISHGAARHWQLDDNIRGCRRWYQRKRIRCPSNLALRATEDFVDRYENVAIAGLNYTMFAHQNGRPPKDPFWLNVHVYSCTLIDHSVPSLRWRGVYNEDTDLCLQALSLGYCTVLMNAFMCDKLRTMSLKGGNTRDLYRGDGRLRMARALERNWPGVVTTKRRWQRPQHVVSKSWRHFDTPLRLKPDAVIPREPNEYGMQLQQVKPIQSPALAQLVADVTDTSCG